MLLIVGLFFHSIKMFTVVSLFGLHCLPLKSVYIDCLSGADDCFNRRIVLLQEYRVVVRIDSWESTSVYPNGHFVRVLGRIGDLEGEIAAILVENSITVAPFSEIQVSLYDEVHCFLVASRLSLLQEGALSSWVHSVPTDFWKMKTVYRLFFWNYIWMALVLGLLCILTSRGILR